MRRNVHTNTAIEENKNEKNIMTEIPETENKINVTDDIKCNFIKAMKIGYYKEFYKQGLISADELEKLIAMQERTEIPLEKTA